jgi:hypothetical protein
MTGAGTRFGLRHATRRTRDLFRDAPKGLHTIGYEVLNGASTDHKAEELSLRGAASPASPASPPTLAERLQVIYFAELLHCNDILAISNFVYLGLLYQTNRAGRRSLEEHNLLGVPLCHWWRRRAL